MITTYCHGIHFQSHNLRVNSQFDTTSSVDSICHSPYSVYEESTQVERLWMEILANLHTQLSACEYWSIEKQIADACGQCDPPLLISTPTVYPWATRACSNMIGQERKINQNGRNLIPRLQILQIDRKMIFRAIIRKQISKSTVRKTIGKKVTFLAI